MVKCCNGRTSYLRTFTLTSISPFNKVAHIYMYVCKHILLHGTLWQVRIKSGKSIRRTRKENLTHKFYVSRLVDLCTIFLIFQTHSDA